MPRAGCCRHRTGNKDRLLLGRKVLNLSQLWELRCWHSSQRCKWQHKSMLFTPVALATAYSNGRDWQPDPTEDDAVAIKLNCLQVVRFNFELGGRGGVMGEH